MSQLQVKSINFKPLDQLWKHDVYTFLHSLRVADLMYEFGDFLGYSQYERTQLYELGLVHDIGKLKIPKHILTKTAPLSTSEKDELFKHTIYGYDLLKNESSYDRHLLLGVLYHHENIDGTGYPYGIKGENMITHNAQMLRIVDSFDAITSNRSYQSANPYSWALRELERWEGDWYNPELLKSFTELMEKKIF